MTSKSETARLSHPEPVAQEAVDRLWDRPIMELAMVKAGRFFDVTAKQGKIGETRDAYIASNWSHWREDATAEVAALSALAHPSPSPEQGEDDLVQRLERSRTDFWAHTRMDCLREAATALSALRARVAELEARVTELPAWQKPGHQSRPKSTLAAEQSGETGHAGNTTPQSGASEAGPVAYASAGQIGSFEDRPGDEGGVYIPLRKTPIGNFQMPLYATPPDSDAVRAMREVQTIILYGDGDTSDRLNACETVVLAALSNQGSSSNGQ